MRLFHLIAAAGLMLGTLSAQPTKPNILLIVGDDMGYADVGFHGCKDIPTPHLDALAASGVRFTSGYVTGPYCSPTRAAMLTGRYQQRFGHEFNPGTKHGMPISETTIANRLRSAGYVTGLVGKWHLGDEPQFHPQKRGFDEFFGFLPGAHSYFSSAHMMRGTQPIKEPEYLTDAFGREGSAFIETQKGKPWFLYLSFNAVHTPMHADDARLAKFAHIKDKTRQTYAAMMSAMDDAVGEVRKTLSETGQEENTIIMFISDNGGPTMKGVTVNGSSNAPLRGSKRTTLEGGIRVPFLIAWKGKLKPAVYDKPVIQLDLTATALEAAGLNVEGLDGVNLLPYLANRKEGQPHDVLYWRFGDQMAIRMGDFKLVSYDSNVETQTGNKQPVTPVKLYNLASDIGESKDLSTAMPDKVKELQSKWNAWNATLVDPLWGGAKTDEGAEEGRKKREKKS